MQAVEIRRHTMRVTPGQHLSQAGVTLARRLGQSMGPFNRVITSTLPRAYETAIAMGFAVDEQDELFNVLMGGVEDEIVWSAGFAAFAARYKLGGAVTRFADTLGKRLVDVASALPENGSALVISHGGVVEAAVIGCLPQADFRAWGGPCEYCEGARLYFDGGYFSRGEALRLAGY